MSCWVKRVIAQQGRSPPVSGPLDRITTTVEMPVANNDQISSRTDARLNCFVDISVFTKGRRIFVRFIVLPYYGQFSASCTIDKRTYILEVSVDFVRHMLERV